MKLISFFLLLLTLFSSVYYSQNQYTIMSYNLLNYPGSTSAERNPYFRTTIASVEPDVLVVQEILSQAGVNEFLNNVLNVASSGYAAGTFINGPDTDSEIFFKSAYFTFISNTPIPTDLRYIYEFKLVEIASGDTIRIYSVHLKASSGSGNEQQRLAEVNVLRSATDALPSGSFYLVVGDFNIYSSTEPAYSALLNQSNIGYIIDLFNLPGVWNDPAYAPYHTQSTRTRQFGGGATGGMDDRFDMILFSQAVIDTGGIYYIPNSFVSYGNDGNHYNDSINKPPNVAVGQIIADALHYSSDHIPVFARFSFTSQEPTTIQLSVNVTNGWNMVSAPGVNPDGMEVNTWWPNLTGTVWGFNGTVYVSTSTTTPGIGYWMKNTVTETYEYPAIQIVPHDPIPGVQNWNIIGGYETSVSASGITTDPPNQKTGTIWGFNGTIYVVANNLEPGYGYWIKLLSDCDIIIPEAIAKGSGELADYFKEDWGRITMTDAAGISYILYAVKGEVDLDQYEMPPALPGGMFDVRYSSGRVAEDINTSLKTIDMQGITYPLTVRVEGMDIRLQDVTGKVLNQNLKSGEDIVISDPTIQKLMVSGELIPTVYSLEQNYPNPFNPSTVIEFSLPENVSSLKLSIYNVLGEKVAELVNSSLQAGRYSYQWEAQNSASGIYIYELRTDKFVAINKMILIK
jgi:endonuclease/exonuclease/phosphatase family metal-dependent hydrolase